MSQWQAKAFFAQQLANAIAKITIGNSKMTDFVEQTNFVEQNNGAKLYEDIATYPVDSLFNTQLMT